METEEIKMTRGNKIFWTVAVLVILGTLFGTFYRTVILKDFQIVSEISCDTTSESCFHYEPTPCASDDADCLALPPEEAYDYKLISKKASSVYACEQTEEKIDCGEELSCLDGEEDCFYTFCDPEVETCAEIVPEIIDDNPDDISNTDNIESTE